MFAERLSLFLDEDFAFMIKRLKLPASSSGRSLTSVDKATRREFANYLMSVASQAVGLQASMIPFNSSKEQMLAYLMDAFKIDQTQLSRFLSARRSSQSRKVEEYSWRPEIVFRVGQPVFYHKEQEFIKHMTVKVYSFNNEPTNESESTRNTPDTKRIFKFFNRIRLDPAMRVRAGEQMLEELRFTPGSSMSSKRRNGEHSVIESRLNISRCAMRSKNAKTLRFEFWVKVARRVSACNKISRYLKSNSFCFASGSDESLTDNIRDGREFYGFVNINLNQIPAYATKIIYPVLSLKERRVNTSEISLEFRNRDIVDEPHEKDSVRCISASSDLHVRSTAERIINHIRLYLNCLLLHLISLRKVIETKRTEDLYESISNITLENLLYLPAHTLINQHRLQSNLTHLEDESLGRSAVLLLLAKIAEYVAPPSIQSILLTFQLALINLAEHEYTVAHRPFDGKTMQQVEILSKNLDVDTSRDSVIEIEVAALRIFIGMITEEMLTKGWLSKLDSKTPEVEKTLALSCVRLARTLLDHIENNHFVHPKLKTQAQGLRRATQSTLKGVVNHHLTSILDILIETDQKITIPSRQLRRSSSFKRDKAGRTSAKRTDLSQVDSVSWEKLSRDIQQIDHDLTINWSQTGFDSLAIDESEIFAPNKSDKLNQLIKAMMRLYLAEKVVS